MVIFYILIFIMLLFFLDIFFPRVFRGRLIVKMKRPRLKDISFAAIMWGLLAIGWSSSFIRDIIRHNENNLYTINKFPTYWAVFSFFHAIKTFKSIEIREKGICVHDGIFYKFKKINFYTLKSPYIMAINYKNLFKEDQDYELKFKDQEEASKFDEVLQNYVKKA